MKHTNHRPIPYIIFPLSQRQGVKLGQAEYIKKNFPYKKGKKCRLLTWVIIPSPQQ